VYKPKEPKDKLPYVENVLEKVRARVLVVEQPPPPPWSCGLSLVVLREGNALQFKVKYHYQQV